MGSLMRLAALLFLVLMEVSCCEGCWKQERDRLLDFKARFGNPDPLFFNVLSDLNSSYLGTQELLDIPEPFINWVDGTDCCQWEGVQCNSTTRRVVKLTLDCAILSYRYLNLSDFLVFDDLKTLNLSGIVGCVGNGGIYISHSSYSLHVLRILCINFQHEKETFIYEIQHNYFRWQG